MYGAQKYHEKFDELKVRVPSGEGGDISVCMQQEEVKQSTSSSTEQQKKTIERDKQK